VVLVDRPQLRPQARVGNRQGPPGDPYLVSRGVAVTARRVEPLLDAGQAAPRTVEARTHRVELEESRLLLRRESGARRPQPADLNSAARGRKHEQEDQVKTDGCSSDKTRRRPQSRKTLTQERG